MEIRRGEVWLANLSPTQGTEQAGIRPVLIIQTDRANPHSPHTIIVPFTTKIRKEIFQFTHKKHETYETPFAYFSIIRGFSAFCYFNVF
ncbi:MAG TPA: type II toxin-antitoxin system PemK/MazF family toxin [Candidatus Wunengus sp. YC60]|uniref:type II toxin-antitoxin system PemK/MazF family toxin n=1 Tax=Candidatus Wunengus sp. YC60 TaxID=3367697 RepID=UPI004029D7BC